MRVDAELVGRNTVASGGLGELEIVFECAEGKREEIELSFGSRLLVRAVRLEFRVQCGGDGKRDAVLRERAKISGACAPECTEEFIADGARRRVAVAHARRDRMTQRRERTDRACDMIERG